MMEVSYDISSDNHKNRASHVRKSCMLEPSNFSFPYIAQIVYHSLESSRNNSKFSPLFGRFHMHVEYNLDLDCNLNAPDDLWISG